MIPSSAESQSSHAQIQFQGEFGWDFFWLPLVESASRFNLAKIRLNVHLPHCHEDFFSQWTSPDLQSGHEGWRLRLPLSCDGDTIGKVEIQGLDSEDAAATNFEFVEFFQTLESELYLTIERDILANRRSSAAVGIIEGETEGASLTETPTAPTAETPS